MANEIQKLRIQKRILELTTELFYKEMKNNDIGFVTFTYAQLNSDFSQVKIGVSVYAQTQPQQIEALTALQKASGFFRSRIGKVLRLRHSPQIVFVFDDSFAQQEKIDSLIDEN